MHSYTGRKLTYHAAAPEISIFNALEEVDYPHAKRLRNQVKARQRDVHTPILEGADLGTM
jgi:hypothetical protein